MTTRIRIGGILIALIVLMTIPVTASESVQLVCIRGCSNNPPYIRRVPDNAH